jgi:hypothetical protein
MRRPSTRFYHLWRYFNFCRRPVTARTTACTLVCQADSSHSFGGFVEFQGVTRPILHFLTRFQIFLSRNLRKLAKSLTFQRCEAAQDHPDDLKITVSELPILEKKNSLSTGNFRRSDEDAPRRQNAAQTVVSTRSGAPSWLNCFL